MGLQKWVRVSPFSQAMCHWYEYHKKKTSKMSKREQTTHKCQSSAWPLGKAFLGPGCVASPSGKSVSCLATSLQGREKEESPHILTWLPKRNGHQQPLTYSLYLLWPRESETLGGVGPIGTEYGFPALPCILHKGPAKMRWKLFKRMLFMGEPSHLPGPCWIS